MSEEYIQNMPKDRNEYNNEIDEYVSRFRDEPREKILRYIGELSTFIRRNMVSKKSKLLEEVVKK